MSTAEKEIVEFNLSDLLEYSAGGNKENTACIFMRAPRMTELNQSTGFSQIVTQAFMDAQKWASKDVDTKQENDKDMDAGAVRIMLFASDRNINEISKRFKELACRVCTVDGKEIYLKEALINRLSLDDFLNMMCTYVANFIYPSLSNVMEDKGEEQSQEELGEASEAT